MNLIPLFRMIPNHFSAFSMTRSRLYFCVNDPINSGRDLRSGLCGDDGRIQLDRFHCFRFLKLQRISSFPAFPACQT
jgi:hypothetical protein